MHFDNFILSQRYKNFEYTKGITEKEYSEIQAVHNSIEYIKFFLWRIKEIDLNYNDLHSALLEYEKECKTNDLRMERIPEIFVNTNRLFINFITSFKFFIDYLDNNLKKRYGLNSSIYKAFSNFCTYNYETYFSYRFFYNLRNYCQHSNYPIYNFSEDKNYFNGTVTNKQFKVEFNKRKLLEDKTIKSKLKTDFITFGNTFPIQPHLKEILLPIKRIEPTIFKLLQSEIVSIIEKLKALQNEAKWKDIVLNYSKVSTNKGIQHSENKIIQYMFALELEAKNKIYIECNFT